MQDIDFVRSARLFTLLTGRGADDDTFRLLASTSSCFAHFRVRLVLDSKLVPGRDRVLGRWLEAAQTTSADRTLADALHTIEQLSMKQNQLERTILDLGSRLLEHLRQLDGLSDSLARAHQEAADLKAILRRQREVVLRISDGMESRKELTHARS